MDHICPPLCKENNRPIRQDLTVFWNRVERNLPGLCADFEWDRLGGQELGTLGPYLLGEGAWKKLPRKEFLSWEDFKMVVDRAVGLTSGAMRMAFLGLNKDRGETDEAYILRCEEERQHHGEAPEVCLGLFY